MIDRLDHFYLVHEDVLPEALLKAARVKELLRSGTCRTINEAVDSMDISRSAYYKYKDFVYPFVDTTVGKIVSIYVTMSNVSGMLSKLLHIIAKHEASVLTINQNIPLQSVATVSISIETKQMVGQLADMIADMESIEGILNIDILGQGEI